MTSNGLLRWSITRLAPALPSIGSAEWGKHKCSFGKKESYHVFSVERRRRRECAFAPALHSFE